MYENVKTVNDGSFSYTALGFLKGVLFAALFTLAVFLLSAVFLSYTPMPESAIPYISFVTQVIGAAISGFIPAKRAGVKGLVTGGVSALLYMLILWLISSLAADGFFMGKHVLTMFLLSLASGALGGILGVNFKDTNSNKKKR